MLLIFNGEIKYHVYGKRQTANGKRQTANVNLSFAVCRYEIEHLSGTFLFKLVVNYTNIYYWCEMCFAWDVLTYMKLHDLLFS